MTLKEEIIIPNWWRPIVKMEVKNWRLQQAVASLRLFLHLFQFTSNETVYFVKPGYIKIKKAGTSTKNSITNLLKQLEKPNHHTTKKLNDNRLNPSKFWNTYKGDFSSQDKILLKSACDEIWRLFLKIVSTIKTASSCQENQEKIFRIKSIFKFLFVSTA